MGFLSKFENRMEDTFEGAAQGLSNSPISPVQIAKKAEKQMRREKMVGAGKQYAPTLYTVFVNPDDDARLFGYYPTLAGETETYLKAKANQEGLEMDGQPLVRFIVDEGLRRGKFDVVAEAVASPIIAQLRNEEYARYGISPRNAGGAYAQNQGGYPPQQAPRQQAPQYQQPQQPRQSEPFFDDYANYDSYENNEPAQETYNSFDNFNEPANDPFAPREDFLAAEPDFEPQQQRKPPLPYVPEDEIDYSIDYGEYTFNSEDFEDYRRNSERLDAQRPSGAIAPSPEAEAAAAADATRQAPRTVAFSGAGVPDAHTVRARLVDLAYQRVYDLSGTRVTLGRSSSNDIVVQDINASRQHAVMQLNNQGIWVITDQRSVNGTLVNGAPVASQSLYNGDHITLGKTDFEFQQG